MAVVALLLLPVTPVTLSTPHAVSAAPTAAANLKAATGFSISGKFIRGGIGLPATLHYDAARAQVFIESPNGRVLDTWDLLSALGDQGGYLFTPPALTATGGAHTTWQIQLGRATFVTRQLSPLASWPQDRGPWGARVRRAVRAFAPAGDGARAEAILRRFLATPYVDSLHALFGRPTIVVARAEGARAQFVDGMRYAGLYTSQDDRIVLEMSTVATRGDLDDVYAHELAHRLQARAGAGVATWFAGVPVQTDPERYGYGAPAEQLAEACRVALRFLRSTETLTLSDTAAVGAAAARLAALDASWPGATRATALLLTHPLFAKHPFAAADRPAPLPTGTLTAFPWPTGGSTAAVRTAGLRRVRDTALSPAGD